MASNDWRKLLGAWYNGLSKRITLLCKRVKAVRANICVRTLAACQLTGRADVFHYRKPVQTQGCN